MSCISCEIVGPLEKIALKYSQTVFDLICNQTLNLFMAMLCIWIVYQVVLRGIIKGELNIYEIMYVAIIPVIITMLLRNHEYIWENILNPIYVATNQLLVRIIVLDNGNNESKQLVDILNVTEKFVLRIFKMAKLYADAASITYLTPLLVAFILLPIYLLLWCLFLYYILEYILVFTIVYALAPIFMSMYFYKGTKNIAIGAIVVLANCIFNSLLSVMSMSILLFVLRFTFNDLPIDESERIQNLQFWIFSSNFWVCIMIGIVIMLFMFRINHISSMLTKGMLAGRG